MNRHILLILKSWLIALIFLPLAPASAQDLQATTCHAYSDTSMAPARALDILDWTCGAGDWEDGREFTWLRFEAPDGARAPEVFSSRMTVFESMTIAAIGRDGTTSQREYTLADARPVRAGPIFTVPLPDTPSEILEYVVAIERPHSVTVASEARLVTDPERAHGSLNGMILLAVVTGMLIMPLLFDGLFFLVLRERFVLLHAAMTVAMIVYVLASGGVATAFVTLPVHVLAVAGPLAWALGVGFGGLFAVSFLERDILPYWMRKTLAAAGLWAMIVPGFCALQLDATQSFDNRLYFYALAPILPIYFTCLLAAVLRGSRAGVFLSVAWLPVILASADRLFRGVGFYTASDSIDSVLFFALAFEVITVALGVADRFIAIRRERDLALTAARSLEELSERDALTGLLNRRGLESRFRLLRSEGFTTMAVLDLDYFKLINDRHGHATGDEVLKCVASALRDDDKNSLAFRMGGEEFVLLMRGRNTFQRAEQRRKAITERAAADGGIPDLVTASMGIVRASQEVLPDIGFEDLYGRADRLLYEAKAAGRDRTMSERLKVFRPRRQQDRRVAA